MNTYTKQKDGTIAVLIKNEWKPATTTRNKHGILQALSADGKQWEDLPASLQDQQAPTGIAGFGKAIDKIFAPSTPPAAAPLNIPYEVGKMPSQMATFPAYPGTTAQPGITTTQPKSEYQSPDDLISAGIKGLRTGLAVDAPRSAVNVASGAARINRSMLARMGYKTDQAKYEQELNEASALPETTARERMIKEGELERLKAAEPEEPIIEKAYNFVQELTEVTAARPEFKADLENMTQMERDVYSGLRSLPVSLGAGAAGAATVAAVGLTGVPLAVGAGVSTLIIMGLSSGEDFIRNWEKQAETEPKLKAIVENLAKKENIPFDEAKQEMFDQMEINKKGVYYGLAEAIPEALGNLVTFWTAGFGKPLAAPIKTGIGSILKTGAKMIGGGAVEIGTEEITGIAQRGIEEKAGMKVEPMMKMLRDTFGSTLIMTIASGGLLKGTNLAMRYNIAEKAGISPTDVPATTETFPDIPATPETKSQASEELRRAANEIKATDPKRAEDIEIIAVFQENIADMSAEERTDIVTSMMTRQGRIVAQGIVDKQNKLERAQADIEKEKTTGQTDYLTGINNRSGLLAAKTAEHTQAIILDIDLFKNVNDTNGHPVGDVVLKDAAFRAQAIATKYGAKIGRIGGEEFTLLVPQGQDAAVISEEIRAEMESRPSEAFGKEIPFTVSVGYAPVDATGDPWATADKYLYKAKQAGRNRVMGIAPTPAVEGEGYVTEGQGQEPLLAAERTPAEIGPPAQTIQQPPAAPGAGEGQAPGGGAVRTVRQIQEITPEDIAILKAGRADLEAVKGVPSKRTQLFRNLERAYIQRHGLPTLGLTESPSVIIPLVDKAINKGKLTDIQTRKVLETVRALQEFNEQVIQNPVPLQEINIGDLEVGDTFNIAGEKFTVKEYKDGEYTIEDGKTYKVDPFEKLAIDEGTLAKEEATTEKTPAGDQAVMGGLAGREMPRGPIKQKPSIATDRGTIFDEEGLKTDREVMAARGQTEMGKSTFVSQAVDAGVDPEVAEATRILGEAFAKATGISVDKVLPQITTEAPGAGMLAQREAQINSPEFKKWFGNSKVVDKDGKPLVVYHGTVENLDIFRKEKTGIFFTDNPQAASLYSEISDRAFFKDGGSNVMPVYLAINNPKTINSEAIKEVADAYGDNPKELAEDFRQSNRRERDRVVEFFIEKGYDGLIIEKDMMPIRQEDIGSNRPLTIYGDVKSYVVFSPTQIKSATGNRGTFSPTDPNILHQEAQLAEPFYSKLRKVIDDKMPNSADTKTINGIMAGSGVKNDELTWSGVKDFLEGKDKVSKQELLDYLDKNQVEVKEVVSHDKVDQGEVERLSRIVNSDAYNKMPIEDRQVLQGELAAARAGGNAKFSQYQLPGGENYREVLVTMPEMKSPEHGIWQEYIKEMKKKYGEDFYTAEKMTPIEDAKLKTLHRAASGGSGAVFTSSHFEEPNVLYHLRLNDRTTADGKKMLFAEEIQSDWHQKGREEGYAKPALSSEERAELNQLGNKRTPEQEARYQADQSRIRGNAVPPAPFSKTWHEQAVKRLIRYAAENGYDGIGWTTGEQQAKRYDLSKQVDYIKSQRLVTGHFIDISIPTGLVNLKIDDLGKVISQKGSTGIFDADGKPLSDVIGKELAKKIIEDKGKERVYRDADLKVGGEGMKGFYDKIIPDFANKYAKKWGSGVEDKIVSGAPPEIQNKFGRSREHAEYTGLTVHYLPITDAMRSDVMYMGQTLFQKAQQPEAKEVSVDYVSETGDKYTEKLLEVPMESAYVREQRDQTAWTKWHKDLAKESKKEGPVTSGRKFAYTSAGEVLVETGPKTDNRVPGVLSGDTERKSQMIVGLSSVEEINKYMDEIFGTEAELDAIQDAGHTTRKLELANIFRADLEYAARERDIKSLMAGLDEIKYLFASDAKNHYTLFQKAGSAIQGAITFDAGKTLIHVLKTANASTLPHELAHNFLKLGTEARYFNDTEIKAMTDFGVLDKNGATTQPGQEKFARSFERYLRDGQSPSEQLKAIFDKFKAWLQEVYAQLQGSAIDIKLTPEIKGIFDRMLGVSPATQGKPFTAPLRGDQTTQATITPKQGEIALPGQVMQAPEATQQDITAPKPEPSKIRNFFYKDYGATMPMPVEPLTRKRINKLAILDFVEKNFGVYVRDRATMRFEEGVAGKHYPEEHIIRLKFWGELDPMMHEIGHELNSKLGSVLGENWKKPFSKELGRMDYDKEQLRPEEGFAEFMRKYFTGDPALEDAAPTFYDFFTQAIKNIPPWDTRINGLREQLEIWQQQGSDARFDAMTEPKPPVNLPKMVKSAWRQLYKTWVDAGEPFSHLEEQLQTVNIKLKPSESPAQLRTYFNKKTRSKAYAWVFDGQFDPMDPSAKLGPSLSEIIVKTGIKGTAQLKNFVRYGTARRVMERYEAHGLEAGFDVNDAEYVAGKYQNPIWDQALDEITKWNDNLLRLYLLKPGLISEEQLAMIREMNPMYIPMKRIIDNGERYGIGGGKELESGAGLKRVKGGSHPVENFLKAMSEQAQGIIARGEKAFIGKALADLAEQKNVAGIIVQVAAPIQVTKVSPEQAKISFSKDDAKLSEKKLTETMDYEAVTEALKAQGIDVKAEDLDAILTIFTQAPAYKGKDNIISLWRDGKQKFYEVDNNLYQALQSMDAKFKWPFLDFVRRGAAMFSRGLRLGATGLNASFSLITNPVFRDPFTYAIFSKKPLPTPLDPISTNLLRLGLFGGKTENILRAERSGLGGASFLGMDKNLVYDEIMLRSKDSFGGNTLLVVRHPIEFLKEIFSWPEMGPRLTEYDNVYNQSVKDHPDWSAEDHNIFAFNAAQDVTVNFTRGGNASFAINEFAAFSNVAIQGPEKMIRAIRENPVGVIAKGVAYLTIMGVANYLSNRDREWYNNLPLAYRYNNLWFEVKGAVVRVPLPFELGSVFIAAPCATMEALRQKRPDDFAALVEIFKAQMPNLLPTVTEPIIDIMRNKDWLGNPIEGEGMKYLPVTERKKYYTTEVASALSKGFDKFGMKLSPVQIDYLFNGWTGGIVKNLPNLDIKETADIPIIGKYVLRMPENPRRQLEEFFTAEEVLMQDDAFARAIDTNLTDAEEDRLADIKNFRKSWTKYYAKDLKEYSSAMSTGDKTAHAKLVKTYREIRDHLSDIGFK